MDRPDLICRVFALKAPGLKQGPLWTVRWPCLRDRVLEAWPTTYAPPIVAYVGGNCLTVELSDEIVYAELPDMSWDPTGMRAAVVTGHIYH